jgi:hypothetical protein
MRFISVYLLLCAVGINNNLARGGDRKLDARSAGNRHQGMRQIFIVPILLNFYDNTFSQAQDESACRADFCGRISVKNAIM